MSLTFIGYRGSGKSTVGSAVAMRLGRPFIDADAEIERREGRTVQEIFTSSGESYFREIERQVMTDLLPVDDLVIASGGGAILSAETRELMRRSGPVIYLRITPETALRRIEADVTSVARRPALTDLAPLAEIESLMKVRSQYYQSCASISFDADELHVDELVERVLAALPPSTGEETAT